ncbi:MAG: hypothetical protein K9H49_19080 [Bacteroidales bacterium]|nr:hypothetical protein [Bacteroidales bacterium]MCF8390190.1 hypothetical protein [Bacteroidales bacterium]
MIKRITLFILVLIVPLTAFNQEPEINKYDNQGLKTGVWKKYFENGNLLYEGTFYQGKPVGTLRRYYEGGVLKAELTFLPDGIQSYAKLYYESRNLAAEGKYIGQEKDSTWNYYSFYNKRLTLKESYIRGARNGESIKYYDDGSVAENMMWKNDVMHGLWEQYYENGQLRLTCINIDGVRDGEYSSFNSDGTKSIHGNYIMGKMDGIWEYYAEGNIVDMELEFVDGKMLPNEVLKEKIKEFSKMLEDSLNNYTEPNLSDFL